MCCSGVSVVIGLGNREKDKAAFHGGSFNFLRILHKHSVLTEQKTKSVSVIKISQLMLYREIMAVCSEIHTKHINTVCGQNVELLNVKLAVHIVTTGIQRVKCLL